MVSDTIEPISFSILSACYNHDEFIEEAINSVISQTYPHWELIIVDDKSTDNSVAKIKPYLKDPRIKLIVHKKNKGLSATLRDAVKSSSKKIIGLFDTDDTLHQSALEVMAKAYHQNPECGLIYSNCWICDSKLNITGFPDWVRQVDPSKTNAHKYVLLHFMTFQRECYEKTTGFNPIFKVTIDADICLKIEEHTKLKFIDKPLYYYRVNHKGVSQSHRYQVKVENYIAKVNTFYRRLNSDIPNTTLDLLYSMYYHIIFFKIIRFFNSLIDYFRISDLYMVLRNRLPNTVSKLEKVFTNIKKKTLFSQK